MRGGLDNLIIIKQRSTMLNFAHHPFKCKLYARADVPLWLSFCCFYNNMIQQQPSLQQYNLFPSLEYHIQPSSIRLWFVWRGVLRQSGTSSRVCRMPH